MIALPSLIMIRLCTDGGNLLALTPATSLLRSQVIVAPVSDADIWLAENGSRPDNSPNRGLQLEPSVQKSAISPLQRHVEWKFPHPSGRELPNLDVSC